MLWKAAVNLKQTFKYLEIQEEEGNVGENLILAYIDHSCNVSLATRIHYVLCRSLKYDLSYPVFFLAAPNYPNIIVCIKENRKNTK